MAQIARENGINDNLLFNWRHQYRKGKELPQEDVDDIVAFLHSLNGVYPFMKRYTHLPQVVLGAAFGWSIPMAFAAVSAMKLNSQKQTEKPHRLAVGMKSTAD